MPCWPRFVSPDVVGGAFRFKIRDPFPGRWLVESTTNLRSRLWQMPYGDQALFVRRWAFDELGGFPDLPIMEDYEFVRRLRTLGQLALLEAPVLTSGSPLATPRLPAHHADQQARHPRLSLRRVAGQAGGAVSRAESAPDKRIWQRPCNQVQEHRI